MDVDLDAVYTILVQTCGAGDGADPYGNTDRWYFIESVVRQFNSDLNPGMVEYRFQGALGFGGKFHIAHGRAYVSCYPEDEDNERRGRIAVANQMLADLVAGPGGISANRPTTGTDRPQHNQPTPPVH